MLPKLGPMRSLVFSQVLAFPFLELDIVYESHEKQPFLSLNNWCVPLLALASHERHLFLAPHHQPVCHKQNGLLRRFDEVLEIALGFALELVVHSFLETHFFALDPKVMEHCS
uniref:Uncharacterized protein n=1 Tax=Cannabis sativa TaxID=3483 RepID=A0A803PNL6_CANSA